MIDLKDKVALIIDNGIFFELALKISSYFKQSYFYVNWKESYPHILKAMVGSEWKNGKQLSTFDGKPFTRVENMFDYLDKVDIIIFLDIYDNDLQEHLVQMGYPVFGGRKGEELELERWDTKQHFKKIG